MAVPPGVVIPIGPVTAPVGTVAATWVSEFTVNWVVATPPNVTFVVCNKLTPVIVTSVPTGPLGGEKLRICGVTKKLVALLAFPPGVLMTIFPVSAPLGTTAATCVSESTVKLVAATPPNVTFLVCVRLAPVIVTDVPTIPVGGVKLAICGVTRNLWLLFSVPPGVATDTKPVIAPAGTVAARKVSDFTTNWADLPLNKTLVVPVNPCPRTSTFFPTLSELRIKLTNGLSPTDSLKIVP